MVNSPVEAADLPPSPVEAVAIRHHVVVVAAVGGCPMRVEANWTPALFLLVLAQCLEWVPVPWPSQQLQQQQQL